MEQSKGIYALTDEIKNCLSHELWYAALVLALTLPDVCAVLESANGQTSDDRYKAWFDTWLKGKYLDVSADDIYSLRCGVAHQGTFHYRGKQYRRIFFTLRPDGKLFHELVLNDALDLDLDMFCNGVIRRVEEWFALKQTDAHVQT